MGSSTVAATPPSLSARRDSDRASRNSAVTAFAEGGSGRSTSSSVMPSVIPSIVLRVGHRLPTTNGAVGFVVRRRNPQRRRDWIAVDAWTRLHLARCQTRLRPPHRCGCAGRCRRYATNRSGR